MKLYGFPASPNTWKVRAVAAHLGIPLEFEYVDLMKGQQRTPEYLALNPCGRTPTLVDGDFTLWESTAIMQYIASREPNTLWPDNPRARADIMRWQSWQLQHYGPESSEPLLIERLVKKLLNFGPPNETVVAKALECFARDCRVLDAHLAKAPWLAGQDATLADFSVAAPLFHAQAADLPLSPYPHILAWFGRVSALPGWRETAPQPPAAAAA